MTATRHPVNVLVDRIRAEGAKHVWVSDGGWIDLGEADEGYSPYRVDLTADGYEVADNREDGHVVIASGVGDPLPLCMALLEMERITR